MNNLNFLLTKSFILLFLLTVNITFHNSLLASHYSLNDINITTPEENFKFFKLKIFTTKKLFFSLNTVQKRKKLEKKLKIPYKRLLELAKKCDLLRMRGIGPRMVELLNGSGVYTIKDLRKQNPKKLQEKMKKYKQKKKLQYLIPDREFLEKWIEKSQSMKILLEE